MTTGRGAVVRLHNHYTDLETAWSVVEAESDYGSLVIPAGNAREPIHGWFRFKEAFSHGLFERLVKDSGWMAPEHFEVFDPFVGSGTTMLSALEYARGTGTAVSVRGVERNPVMFTIANAKVRAAAAPPAALAALSSAMPSFRAAYGRLLRDGRLSTASVTLNNSAYFTTESALSLLALGRAARSVQDELARELLSVCVASAVEPSGKIRKDGRALRYMPDKVPVTPLDAFEESLARMERDLGNYARTDVRSVELSLGDARYPVSAAAVGGADWAVFSPPYPNNIDYTEVYKVEAWVLGMFAGSGAVREQRLSTLRSHPSVLFPEQYAYVGGPHMDRVTGLVEPILEAVPTDRYSKGRNQVIRGYADDMLKVLAEVRCALKEGGRAAVVVGNSSHGQGEHAFVVAADLLIAGLAELVDFSVEEIRIARRPRRRPDLHGWLRESVVVLRAGHGARRTSGHPAERQSVAVSAMPKSYGCETRHW